MQSWNRLLASGSAVLLLGLLAGAAHATSMGGCPGPGYDAFNLGEVQSGQLLFSNFCFFSPAGSVDPDDLTIEIVDQSVEISGPITLTGGGWAKFYVSYEVTAVDPLIDGASLELDSLINAPLAAVFATKRVIGEGPDEPPCNHHGWGFPHGRPGHGPRYGNTLAFLKTAEWDVGCLCNGEFRFDEESFDPQESITVIDGVWIVAFGGDSDVTFFSSANSFSVVPEPATAALVTLGLLGLAIGGRRF